MYLMDTIRQLAGIVAARRVKDPVLVGYADLADRLVGAPRFLLDPAATRTIVELNLGRPKVTLEAMAHIRVPYSRLWVEWDDADRQRLREKFDEPLSFAELRPMPGRVGFLLETEAGGRAGTATWAWTNGRNHEGQQKIDGVAVPNIGAVQPYFDLDRRFELSADRVEGLRKGNLAKLWHDNPVQLGALFDIWRTSIHAPSAWGEQYFEVLGNASLPIALSYADVVGEYIMIWATMLLLTASRPVVDLDAVDLSRLNKRRQKRGDVPLLDHTRVSMRLTPMEHRPIIRGALGFARKSPRVHLVSRYLARRGDRHWIVEPYWRGTGDTIARQVNVRG